MYKFDGETPEEWQKEKFIEIRNFFINQIDKNEEIRIVHKWKENDLVFSDLFRLAHAVTGGFHSSERKFLGTWAYGNEE